MKSLNEIRDYIKELVNEYNGRGGFYTGKLQEDDSKFTVLESWHVWEQFVTMVINFAELDCLYKEAIAHSDNKDVMQYGDLRLGRNGLFPGDFLADDSESTKRYGSTPYLVPDTVQPVEELIEELVGGWGFADEWDRCDNCGKILRTSPDSYCWTPDYTKSDYGRLCKACTSVSDTLEEYACLRKGLPWFVVKKAIAAGDIIKMEPNWENGFHHGMNDDPKKIGKWLREHGIEQWWWSLSPSQFYVDFSLLLSPEGVVKLALLWKEELGDADDGDVEAKANLVLENIDAYQGYDTATEMSLALQGKATAHVKVITTTFANGVPTTTVNPDPEVK